MKIKGDAMVKKILKIIGVILLLIVLAAIVLVATLIHNPGLYLRLGSQKIRESQVVEVSYDYDLNSTSGNKTIPCFFFRPSESGSYTFSAVDFESSSEVYVNMNVMDRYLDDYFLADNRDHDVKGQKDMISESTALQASQPCYILFNVEPLDDDLTRYSGSFRLTVTRDSDDEGPPQLTTDGPVTIKTESEGQACAVFIPPETGYYGFEHSIVSRDSSKGYSGISSITSSDKVKVGVTNDICMLQKDKEYFVWVAVDETHSRRSEIELSCRPMKTEKANDICSLDLTGDSVIEYIADKDCNLAVYTVSAGDPKLVIYERAGLPLRTDDRSEASLSDNPDDVATVLRVTKETGLHICVFGDVTDCRVFITEYTGDGTSLTTDDIVPVPETEAENKTVTEPETETEAETESEAETGSE